MAVSLTQILQTFETIETFRKTILRVKIKSKLTKLFK